MGIFAAALGKDFVNSSFGEYLERVTMFAYGAHAAHNQRRKYTGEHYIAHPIAVAGLVLEAGLSHHIAAAAILHDVVEDTRVDPDLIAELFGDRVRDLVLQVTDVSRPQDGNRETRKRLDREHVAKASPDGKAIKLADLIHNARDIVDNDLEFARRYLPEKAALLEVLHDSSSPYLYDLAVTTLNECQLKLQQQ